MTPVRIVGVIDLRDGRAVHARGGRRNEYAPVHQSAGFVIDGSPLALAQLYVDTFGLSDIYVADLDAIASRALQAGTIRGISALGASLWVDAGITRPGDTTAVVEAGAQAVVVGLETLTSIAALAEICAQSARPVTFSLDLRAGTPMSDAMAAWPAEEIAQRAAEAGASAVIVLDVARVGTAGGPDFDLLRRIRSAVPSTPLFAGGGIRGLDDVRRLSDVGCSGALVATAIHERRLTPAAVSRANG